MVRESIMTKEKKILFSMLAALLFLFFLYVLIEAANQGIEFLADCRDPALVSYYPENQIRRFKTDELPNAFGVSSVESTLGFYREFAEAGSVYEPFVETRSRPIEGKFYGLTAYGFRRTSKENIWPPFTKDFSVFFFGGSTCFHTGPWWTGVAPALRQELLHQKGRAVEVYNFGRSSYFSTQERILFEQLILEGKCPKQAIFLDGLNDLQIADGIPLASPFISSLYDRATWENQAKYLGNHHRLFWSKLQEAWGWSAPMVLLANLRNLSARQGYVEVQEDKKLPPDLSKAVTREQLVSAIDRMVANWKMINALGENHGISTIFVLQPVPVFKYNLKYHHFVPKEWPASMSNVAAGYPMLKKRCAEEKGLKILDLSDMQSDSTENLYVDSCHYTAEFAKKIASRILVFAQEQK